MQKAGYKSAKFRRSCHSRISNQYARDFTLDVSCKTEISAILILGFHN
jgi:hypothetical protein